MPPNPNRPSFDEETTEHEFGCDPEEFYKKYPGVKLKGTIYPDPKKTLDEHEQQQMIEHCATMLQDMAGLFETIASDCKHATGSGGCKLSADGCTGVGCPIGGE